MLIRVNPGIMLISLMMISSPFLRKKSTRAKPSQQSTVNVLIANWQTHSEVADGSFAEIQSQFDQPNQKADRLTRSAHQKAHRPITRTLGQSGQTDVD